MPKFVEPLFHALADPTRRQVVERLSRGPASVSELAEPFDMSLPSFVQHLGVLEQCGLIGSRKAGRVRTCYLEIEALEALEQWVAGTRQYWEARVDALSDYAEKLHLDEKDG